MTPMNNTPQGNRRSPKGPATNTGTDAISRVKLLLAAGAVGGTMGGWALMARDGATTVAETATPQATTVVLAQSLTPTTQATATLQQALQATTTPAAQDPSTATSTVTSTATPTATLTRPAQASATPEVPTDTPTPQPTATATMAAATNTPTPEPTATTAPVATAIPQPVTRSRSSR